jgi:hypothetical protein
MQVKKKSDFKEFMLTLMKETDRRVEKVYVKEVECERCGDMDEHEVECEETKFCHSCLVEMAVKNDEKIEAAREAKIAKWDSKNL